LRNLISSPPPADKSRAIAAILTPALKFGGLLEAHTPLFVVEADDSQAGKGFLLELVQMIYRETASIVTQRQGGVASLDESLAQAMLDGRPFIQLDNVRGHIGSPYFEAILTCPLGGTFPVSGNTGHSGRQRRARASRNRSGLAGALRLDSIGGDQEIPSSWRY
jgi:hypothetical protein